MKTKGFTLLWNLSGVKKSRFRETVQTLAVEKRTVVSKAMSWSAKALRQFTTVGRSGGKRYTTDSVWCCAWIGYSSALERMVRKVEAGGGQKTESTAGISCTLDDYYVPGRPKPLLPTAPQMCVRYRGSAQLTPHAAREVVSMRFGTSSLDLTYNEYKARLVLSDLLASGDTGKGDEDPFHPDLVAAPTTGDCLYGEPEYPTPPDSIYTWKPALSRSDTLDAIRNRKRKIAG